MTQRSKVAQLDPRVRVAVDDAVREGRASIDEIVGLIRSMGADASRSSVGRYVKNANEQLKHFREAQEIAKVWAGKLTEDPEGDIGRLVTEMLKVVAYQQVGDMGTEGSETKPMDVMLLAKALDHLSRSQKVDVDRWAKTRDEFAKKAAAAAAEIGKSHGLSDETMDELKRSILGIQ